MIIMVVGLKCSLCVDWQIFMKCLLVAQVSLRARYTIMPALDSLTSQRRIRCDMDKSVIIILLSFLNLRFTLY